MRENYESLAWNLLAASPELNSGVFEEAVILLLEDNRQGSFGIIINKPEGKILADYKTELDNSPLGNLEVFHGGPVSAGNVAFAVWKGGKGITPKNFDYGLTPQKVAEELEQNPNAKAAVFDGYTGWGVNQLRDELKNGLWIKTKISHKLLMDVTPESMWGNILLKERPFLKNLPKPLCLKNFKN